jgi:malate/lactate dehydrogenase
MKDIAVSVPARIGAKGVDRVISVEMSAEETRGLLNAAEELRSSLKRATGLAG